MSADNPRNPGDRPDPGYQGAKPGTVSDSSDFWTFFGTAGTPQTSNAMSAALARNWWLVALRGVLAILFGVVAILLPGPTLAERLKRGTMAWREALGVGRQIAEAVRSAAASPEGDGTLGRFRMKRTRKKKPRLLRSSECS